MINIPIYPFQLPALAFDYRELEPWIDETTMQIHHQAHHQAYIDNLNDAIKPYTQLQNLSIEELLRHIETIVPESIRCVVRNQGGGHANHQMFWKVIRPNGIKGAGGAPTGELRKAMERDFGSVEDCKAEFEDHGTKLFGSGWVFLVYDSNAQKLKIHTTTNQDSVLLTRGYGAVFGNDMWEHAYYLKHKNRRLDYLKTWWNVLAREIADERYQGLVKGATHFYH